MIRFNWSATVGLVSWSIEEPYREPLIKPIKRVSKTVSSKKNLSLVLGVASPRTSKGNHKWKLAVLKKELKRRYNQSR